MHAELVLTASALSPLVAPLLVWAKAHEATVITVTTWELGALVVNTLYRHVSPTQLVALIGKNKVGGIVLALFKTLGKDPVRLLQLLQSGLNSEAAAAVPQLVSELPTAVQAVVKDPQMIAALEAAAASMLAAKTA